MMGAAWLTGSGLDGYSATPAKDLPAIPGFIWIGQALGSGEQGMVRRWESGEDMCAIAWSLLSNKIRLYVSPDGTDGAKVGTSSPTLPAGWNALKALPSADFTTWEPYYSTDYGATWTALGSPVATGATPAALPTSPKVPIKVGSRGSSTSAYTGTLSRCQLLDTDGVTVLADLDLRLPWDRPRTWEDPQQNKWHRYGPTPPSRIDLAGPTPSYPAGGAPDAGTLIDRLLIVEGTDLKQVQDDGYVTLGEAGAVGPVATQYGGTAVSNTTAVSSVQSLTIPAAYLSAGSSFRLRFSCALSTIASGGGFFSRFGMNGTDYAGGAANMQIMTSQTNAALKVPVTWDLRLDVLSVGAAGQVSLTGPGFIISSAAGGRGASQFLSDSTLVTTDTTSGITVVHKVNMGTADAGNIVTPIAAVATRA
jgi:hypothetical protein